MKSITILTFGRGFNAVINLLLLPYMARALDYYDYATYGQVLLITELALVLINIAANQYLYVLFANKEFSQKDIVFNALFINFVLALISVAILFLLNDYLGIQFQNQEIKNNLLIYSFSLPFLLIQSTFNFVLYYFNKYKHSIIIEVLINICRVASIIVAVQVFQSVKLIFIALLAINILFCFAYLIKFPVNFIKGKIDKRLVKNFFRYGYPLGITAILGTLLKRTDGVMVSSISTPTDFAIFRMGAIEIPFLMTLFSSVIIVTLPNVTKLFHDNKIDELITLKKKQ